MSEELDSGAFVPTEPAPIDDTATDNIPATDTSGDLVAEEPQELANDVPAEASTETSVDEDDPFAEFETGSTVRDKRYYEDWFKTKQSHTPNAVRDEFYGLLAARDEADAFLEGLGGRPTLEILKPTIEAILSPDPTREAVDAAFDAIESHNPQVMQQLGGRIAEQWIAEVVSDPVTLITPLVQHAMRQVFGDAANDYDLNRLMEFVQLDLFRDAMGDPILDMEYARQVFDSNGGYNAFRHSQEKADYERRIQELQRGHLQLQQPSAPQAPIATEVDVDADLESYILPKAEAILAKVGYAKNDAEYNLALDALRYRMRNAPEAANIRSFAKNGSYKANDGNYVPGVAQNRAYLERKLQAQLIQELKAVNGRKKGSPAPTSRHSNTANNQPNRPQISSPPPRTQGKAITSEQFIREMSQRGKAIANELRQSDAIAAGR